MGTFEMFGRTFKNDQETVDFIRNEAVVAYDHFLQQDLYITALESQLKQTQLKRFRSFIKYIESISVPEEFVLLIASYKQKFVRSK